MSGLLAKALGYFRLPLRGSVEALLGPTLSVRAFAVITLLMASALSYPAPLSAQEVTNALASTNRAPHHVLTPLPPVLTLPSAGKSPVALFRELLAMPFMERLQALTNRPPEARKQILSKLREYETLKPDERELRLKATELRWYLYPLMRAPQTNRAAFLARIPTADRPLVEDRLREWDKLSPQAQRELLENEAVIRVMTAEPTGSNAAPRPFLTARRVQEWQALPEDERQKLIAQFRLYFQLRPEEQAKVLRTLSEAERQQIEKTLDKFAHLSPAQRRQCMRSFEKFASLSPAERQQFLKNAERWTLMTPEERQKWRELVSLAPMLPVGTEDTAKPPKPFLPPVKRVTPSVATNGG